MTDVTNWVTQCINTKSLLIIFTHDIANNPSEYGCTPTQLTNLLNYLVQQQNAGKIVVMTIAQAYDAWHNAQKTPPPTVVVAFDDANESDYLIAYPLFAARGLKGTSYIVTSYIDGDQELHWTEIDTMRSHIVSYNIHLESKQTTDSTTNLGTVTFNNKSYSLPTNFLDKGGYYQAQYYPANGYTFDHWETTGAIAVSSTTTDPTTVTLNSNGTLRAVYKSTTSTPYTFTDGFESGGFNAWSGTSVTSGETLSIVSSPVHSGTRSAKFTSNGGGNGEYAITYKNVNLNEAYVKASFQITAGLPEINNGDHFYLIGLTGTGNQIYAGVIRTNGVDRWTIHVMNGTTWLNWVTNTTAPLPTLGKWVTILLHWRESSTNGTAELYINGVKTITITNLNTASYGNTTRIAIGITYSYLQKSITVYADDTTISNAPVTP
jgi:hypothetical protein